jgi:hypothetical protein
MSISMRDMQPLHRSRRQVRNRDSIGNFYENLDALHVTRKDKARLRQVGESGFITFRPAK